VLEKFACLVEPELVAAAVPLGWALHVGDPLAVATRVVEWQRAGRALLPERPSVVEEALDCSSGRLGEPAYSPWFEILGRVWMKPAESASPPSRLLRPNSTSAP
jgi:hypothetical protein